MRMRRAAASAALCASLIAGAGCSSEPPAAEAKTAESVLEQALEEHAAGRQDEARRLYHEVLSLDPDSKYAYYNLGLIAQQSNRVPLADALYRAALTIDAKYWPALYNLALIKGSAAGGRREAEILYRKVIALNASYAPAYLNLGLLLVELGKQAEGEAMLARAVQLDPSLKTSSPSPAPPPGPQSSN